MTLQLLLSKAENLPPVKVEKDIKKILDSKKLERRLRKIECQNKRREFTQGYCFDKVGPLTFKNLTAIENKLQKLIT